MNCPICGAPEDIAMHTLLECTLALEIWSASPFSADFWARHYASITDCLLHALETSDREEAGNFLGVLWKVWNCRNRHIFGSPYRLLTHLANRAIVYVRKLGDWGRGLAVVVRDSLGDVVLAGSHQMAGFHGADIAEAEACLFGLRHSLSAGGSYNLIRLGLQYGLKTSQFPYGS
ncbi:hypothetical protein Cgig2_031682 [Carnegiea gigantea]|uniref:RNase H type-1 domain-containing protein n=1 Tax=Carnegiea gigantea TaxID=171969 RepID=A0A9Q1QM10_9CARY|nr:hypothetical protein Cgig2_031682 [Carnegiea gigantea]